MTYNTALPVWPTAPWTTVGYHLPGVHSPVYKVISFALKNADPQFCLYQNESAWWVTAQRQFGTQSSPGSRLCSVRWRHTPSEEQFASSAKSGVGLSVCLSVCPTDTLFYVNSRGGEQGSAPVLIHKIIRRWNTPWVLSDNIPPSAHLWVILYWILDIKIFYLFLFICNLWRWTRACMCRRPQRRRSTLDPLKSELQATVSCPTQVLRTELGSSARTAEPSSPLSCPSVPDCLV